MEIRNDTARRAWIIEDNGVEVGYLSYIPFTGAVDLEYTEIAESHAGRGLAGQLARAALDDIRQKRLKAMISCPAVRAFVNKNPAYEDLIVEP